MNNILKKNNLYNHISNFSILILFIFFFYKLNLERFIPISGDELNSILVYSSNIKTIFLKNFPGNVTFFHLIGYFKSSLFGFELISFKAITFLFLILHFWILKRLNFENNILLIFFNLILISSSFTYYSGQYVGYIFSSFIFTVIFFLIKNNSNDKFIKLILFLLFIQIYNHLVNLYLVLPIIISLFIFSKKKEFIKNFFVYYLIPTVIFYSISIILTGLSVLKVPDTSLNFIFPFLIDNFQQIFLFGFNRIFFYEAYISSESFNIIKIIKDFSSYSVSIFILFLISIVISFLNFKSNNKIFSLIIFLHILTFILIYKNPHPRIFTGFYCFYILIILDFFREKKFFRSFIINKYYFLIFLIFLILQLVNFDYLKKLTPSQLKDLTFSENELSINYLKKECKLINKNFSEIQKRNYYFNYLNKCKKKFSLNEFLNYYRS